MTKQELKGNTSEKQFRKKFPDDYAKIINCEFPDDFKFTQKLYHYLNNDLDLKLGICPVCGRRCYFLGTFLGYRGYCSNICMQNSPEIQNKKAQTKLKRYGSPTYNNPSKNRETCHKKYGVDFYSQTDEWRLKVNETCNEKYGSNYFMGTDEFKNASKSTIFKQYGRDYFTQTDEFIEKTISTCNKKYGCDFYLQSNDFKLKFNSFNPYRMEKIYLAKRKNHTFKASSQEDNLAIFFSNNNINFKRNYRSKSYPFHCDFYLPDYDLYIELNIHWTHGGHPYDPLNQDDLDKLSLWKKKNTKFYHTAISVWTDRDVKKRNIAKQNNLNYLEIFSKDIDVIIKKINEVIQYGY